MAMHFHDEIFLRCPTCENVTMAVRKAYRFSINDKDANALDGEYLQTEVYCTKCGTTVKTLRNAEDIHLKG